MASNVNRVVLTANLCKDPELVSSSSGTQICRMRVACNTRRKGQDGQWVDLPNYFDVTCFGAQAENCHKYLAKGRPIAVDGRLEWREWSSDNGEKRQAVGIVAETIQFLSDGQREGGQSSVRESAPIASGDFGPGPSSDDQDIPFLWEGPQGWESRYHANR
jgi:single-strand DNA-binding protein